MMKRDLNFISNPLGLRLMVGLYLISLALMPWSWFPPFPWLHEHAQWSDVLFALAMMVGLAECVRRRIWPPWRPFHTTLVVYALWAGVSWWMSSAAKANGWKLLGIAELIALAVFTSEFLQRKTWHASFARAIALTTLFTAAGALLGLALFYVDVPTRLIGTYGDLVVSAKYARVQAGTYQPNLLASFCIFASAILAYTGPAARWRRLTQAALCLIVLLTFARGILGFALAAAIRHAHTRERLLSALAFGALCVAMLSALTIWNLSFDPSHPFAWRLEANASSRWQSFTSSLATLRAHPVFGSGTGSQPGGYRELPYDAHCTPVNIAATMGWPGLAAFGAILFRLVRQRRQPLNLALWGGAAGLALDALAQDVEDFRHLWVFIGVLNADAKQEIR